MRPRTKTINPQAEAVDFETGRLILRKLYGAFSLDCERLGKFLALKKSALPEERFAELIRDCGMRPEAAHHFMELHQTRALQNRRVPNVIINS